MAVELVLINMNQTNDLNETFHNDSSHLMTLYSMAEITFLSILVSLLSFATIAGNTLVIASFSVDKKLRTFGNYFILNLAISDLIVGFLIAFYIPYLVTGCWVLGHLGCLVFLFLDYVVPLASAWNMALISLDRYWSVTRPISYRNDLTATRSVAYMTVPWIAGVLWYGPSVLFWRHLTGRDPTESTSSSACLQCQVDFFYHAFYLLISSVVEFLAPFLTVTFINFLIYRNISSRSRGLTTSRDKKASLRARKLLQRDKRSARSLAILIIVFLITWGPFEICSFVNPLTGFKIPHTVFSVVFWLLWLNSTINPILYPYLQHRFRLVFVRILCSFYCCRNQSLMIRMYSMGERSEVRERSEPPQHGNHTGRVEKNVNYEVWEEKHVNNLADEQHSNHFDGEESEGIHVNRLVWEEQNGDRFGEEGLNVNRLLGKEQRVSLLGDEQHNNNKSCANDIL